MTAADPLFRVYDAHELRADGYSQEWHRQIKWVVREQADQRCVRCRHPFMVGESEAEWSPCDELCIHNGPVRDTPGGVEASWRVLTVHHLNGVKADCRWWNLVALCQRCHLRIQSKVHIERPYWPEHSEWFKPYVAGWYAFHYLGEDLTREQVMERLEELLAIEHRQGALL